VRPIDRLCFNRRLPPRVQQEHVLSGGEVQAEAARLQADEKQRTAIVLKPLHAGLAVSGLSVQVLVRQLRCVEPRPQQAEQGRDLREHEHLAAILHEFLQPRHEHVKLGRGIGSPRAINQAGMTRRLA
jgi:hypothetical protein